MAGGGVETDKATTELAANTQLFAGHPARQAISQAYCVGMAVVLCSQCP